MLLFAGISIFSSATTHGQSPVADGTVFATVTASGKCGATGHDIDWYLENGTLTIGENSFHVASSGTVVADYTGTGQGVTSPWYAYRNEITNLEIKGVVTTLGQTAFAALNELLTADLGSVITLGEDCFANCSSLTNIVATNLISLGQYCFGGCTLLTDINNNYAETGIHKAVFPESTNVLGDDLFAGCGLTRIDFLGALQSVEGAFMGWSGNDIVIWDAIGLYSGIGEYSLYFGDYGGGCHTFNLYVPVGMVEDFETTGYWYNSDIQTQYANGFNNADGWEELGSHVLHVYEVSALPDYVAPINGGGSGGDEQTGVVADIVLPSVLVVTIATVSVMYVVTFKRKKRI